MSQIQLIYGNSLPAMREMDDRVFELAIPDPPYGVDGNFYRRTQGRGVLSHLRRNYPTALWEQPAPDDEFFEQLQRISQHQIIWGANYFPQIGPVHKPPRRSEITTWLDRHPVGWIAWDKCNGENTTFNDYELAWTSFNQPTRVFRYMWNGMMQGKSVGEGHIMQGNKGRNEYRIHPTQKPVNLYRYLLSHYARPGWRILDTHAGSGSLLLACYDLGFDVVGYEIERLYYLDARQRIDDHVSQTRLFYQLKI